MPGPGDPRAWDGLIVAPTWSEPVEAETRPTDLQALQRRLALKLRDSGFDQVLLVLLDSRHNRALVREFRSELADAFPIPVLVRSNCSRRACNLEGSSVLIL